MANKRQGAIGKIIGITLDILLIIVTILIIIGGYYIIQIKILKNDYANMFGYTFFEVITGSMADSIQIGDVIIIKLTQEVNEEDIIVYKSDNNFVAHRLIKQEENKLITKGDANNTEDSPIELEQVLGKVIYIIPKIGIWKKVLLSREIIGLIAILIFTLGVTVVYISKSKEEKV